jgi:hypothetical protein
VTRARVFAAAVVIVCLGVGGAVAAGLRFSSSPAPAAPPPRVVPTPFEKGSVSAAPFRYEGWPGEGEPNLVAGDAADVVLRSSPAADSPVADRTHLAAGEPVAFDMSWVVTVHPGSARTKTLLTFDATSYGDVTEISRTAAAHAGTQVKIELEPGQLLGILSYRAGGECFLRLERGRPGVLAVERNARAYGVSMEPEVLAGPCPFNLPGVDLLEMPEEEWWVRLAGPTAAGWLRVDEETVRDAERAH